MEIAITSIVGKFQRTLRLALTEPLGLTCDLLRLWVLYKNTNIYFFESTLSICIKHLDYKCLGKSPGFLIKKSNINISLNLNILNNNVEQSNIVKELIKVRNLPHVNINDIE